MSLFQESLDRRPPAGLSIRQRIVFGSQLAKEKAVALIETPAPSGLSVKEWAHLGLSSAAEMVEDVEELIK